MWTNVYICGRRRNAARGSAGRSWLEPLVGWATLRAHATQNSRAATRPSRRPPATSRSAGRASRGPRRGDPLLRLPDAVRPRAHAERGRLLAARRERPALAQLRRHALARRHGAAHRPDRTVSARRTANGCATCCWDTRPIAGEVRLGAQLTLGRPRARRGGADGESRRSCRVCTTSRHNPLQDLIHGPRNAGDLRDRRRRGRRRARGNPAGLRAAPVRCLAGRRNGRHHRRQHRVRGGTSGPGLRRRHRDRTARRLLGNRVPAARDPSSRRSSAIPAST